MKRFLAALALTWFVAMTLGGCRVADDLHSPGPSDIPGNSGKKELVMATEAGFAPYEYYQGNRIVGVDVDIAKAIADSMGYSLRVVDMDFDAALAAVNKGKADLAAAAITITEERKEKVDFSISYATSKQVLVVRGDSAYKGLEDLGGKVIGVQRGTVADTELTENHPEVTVKRYGKYKSALADLKNGRIEAIGMDCLPAQELAENNPELTVLQREFHLDSYAIAVKKGNCELLDSINAVLTKLMEEGKIAEFTARHTTEER